MHYTQPYTNTAHTGNLFVHILNIIERLLNDNTVFEEVFRKWLESVGNTIYDSKYNSSCYAAKTNNRRN